MRKRYLSSSGVDSGLISDDKPTKTTFLYRRKQKKIENFYIFIFLFLYIFLYQQKKLYRRDIFTDENNIFISPKVEWMSASTQSFRTWKFRLGIPTVLSRLSPGQSVEEGHPKHHHAVRYQYCGRSGEGGFSRGIRGAIFVSQRMIKL